LVPFFSWQWCPNLETFQNSKLFCGPSSRDSVRKHRVTYWNTICWSALWVILWCRIVWEPPIPLVPLSFILR
jgi:hypothetical protein